MTGKVPVRKRVLAVQADLGEGRSPRFLYGSGLLLGGRRMLTAAHVVAGAVSVTVRTPDRTKFTAALDGAKIGDPDHLDLAILDVPEADGVADVALARVNRDVATGAEEVEKCWALGYPAFTEVDRDGTGRSTRVTEEVNGVVPPLSLLEEGMLSFRISSTPRALPPGATTLAQSEWSGMSGAAVFAGDLLVGVVAEHAPRRGASDITVTPLDRLLEGPTAPPDAGQWWDRLGVVDPLSLPLLPRTPVRAEPEYRATLRVMRNRAKPYLIGRRHELDQIADFATGANTVFGGDPVAEGYLWLVGGPWTGKTALLAEAVHTLPPDVDVVAFFLVARESRASQEQFLAAVVPQLAFLVDMDPPAAFSVDTLRALWDRAVDRAEDRHLLLVVDALDEDMRSTGASVAALLPERLDPRARVLVTSRPYPGMPERVELPPDVALHHPLRAAAAKRVVLSDSARAQELKDLADQEIRALLSPLETSPDADLAFDVLGLLAAAGGALAVDDLASLTGTRARLVRQFVTTDAAHSLEAVGSEDRRRYQFAHQTLVDRCREHPDVGDAHYWEMLTAWADGWASKRWPPANRSDEGTPRYLLDTYPAVLAGATPTLYHPGSDQRSEPNGGPGDRATSGDRVRSARAPEPATLEALVIDMAWVDAAVSAVGVDAVLAALHTALLLAPARPALTSMLRLIHLQAHHLRPPYPADRPGYPASQLAWEALRIGDAGVASAAQERARSCPGLQLVPEWSTERTGASLIRMVGRHDGGVQAMAATPDGRVVSGGDDRAVRLWNPDDADDPGRELGRHHSGIWALAATPDGRVASGGDDRAVRLWNPATPDDPGRVLGRHQGWVWAMTATAAGRVVSGGSDGAIQLWDPDVVDDPGRELGCHEGGVWALAATPDGRVVSGGSDGVVRLWNPDVVDDPGRELGCHEGGVWALAATPDGRVVSGGSDGVVRLWNPDVVDDAGRELGRHHGEVRAIATTPDGRVASGGSGGVVRLWNPDAADGRGRELGRHHGRVWAMATTADGRVVSGGDDGAVRLWNPDVPDDGGELDRHRGWLWAVATTPGGRVVSGDDDGAVLLWNPRAPDDPGLELGRHQGGAWAMAATPDGQVVSGGDGGAVLLWDPDAPDGPGRELGRHPGEVRAMAATADGRVVSGGDGGRVLLWDPGAPDDPGQELGRHDGRVWAMATTPDGRVVSGGSDGAVMLWDPDAPDDEGRELGRHPGEVRAMATMPDGRVVSGGDGGRVRLWNPCVPDDPGQELGRHDGGVWAVAATPDGQVVSGGDDGAVRLWNPAVPDDPGRELGRHDGEVRAMAVTPDGQVVIATFGGLTVFRLSPA